VLTAAMSSGQAGGSDSPPAALSRLWNGTVVPLSARDAGARRGCRVSRPPGCRRRGLAPALLDAGVRVIDLSGAFRLRDDGVRGQWYPETHRLR
jgi:hypothetical protein